jgi:hypothetical protein
MPGKRKLQTKKEIISIKKKNNKIKVLDPLKEENHSSITCLQMMKRQIRRSERIILLIYFNLLLTKNNFGFEKEFKLFILLNFVNSRFKWTLTINDYLAAE